jgi:hypothetical protein
MPGSTGPAPEPVACEPQIGVEVPTDCFEPESVPVDSWMICSPGQSCDSLMCDRENCGECGHACFGGCAQGECQSKGSTCFDEDDGIETCEEACARDGAVCEDRDSSENGEFGCDRGYGWTLASPVTGLPGCPPVATSADADNYVDAACDEPIRWDFGTPEQPLTGIRCCCKGDLP